MRPPNVDLGIGELTCTKSRASIDNWPTFSNTISTLHFTSYNSRHIRDHYAMRSEAGGYEKGEQINLRGVVERKNKIFQVPVNERTAKSFERKVSLGSL